MKDGGGDRKNALEKRKRRFIIKMRDLLAVSPRCGTEVFKIFYTHHPLFIYFFFSIEQLGENINTHIMKV